MINSRTRSSTKGAHSVKRASGTRTLEVSAQKEQDMPVQRTGARRKRKKTKAGRRAAVLGIAAGGLLVLLMGALCGFNYFYPNVFPGVSAGAVPVGGKSKEEAEQLIEGRSASLYEGAKLGVKIYEELYEIPVEDVVEGLDSKESAKSAYEVGRKGNPFSRVGQMVRAFAGGGDVQLAAMVHEEGLKQSLNDIAAKALTEPVEPSWEAKDSSLIIHSGKPGVHFDTDEVERTLAEKIRLMDFSAYEVDTELTDTPQIDLDKIEAEASGSAVNATVSKEDGKTIIPEKNGLQFDMDEARKIVGDGSEEMYTIPATVTPAKVTAADLQEKLFRDTLARATTELNEGNEPRTNNVRLASKAINGTILNPGDEFSYNDVVGERTEERGYKPAGAYSGGEVIEEYGGGVCQPSSTLYMAVLRADLEVTERSNHSFTVSYTPLGEDATVSWGGPDFKFRNDTDYPVKILAEQSDGQMIMTLLGTKASDKTVETRTEVIETYSPDTVTREDSSLYKGDSRVEQGGITGYYTRTYKIITENGQTTEELANNSSYSKRDQVVYVGTRSYESEPEASSEPEPEPEPVPEESGEPEPDYSEDESNSESGDDSGPEDVSGEE